jgi:dTDP-4-dehydrorhamnose reductase
MVASTIVITGASGFLGQHLLRHLIDTVAVGDDCKVYAIHNSKPELQTAVADYHVQQEETRKNKGEDSVGITIDVVALDLTSKEAIQQWVSATFGADNGHDDNSSSRTVVDCCIHTAAMSSPARCDSDPEGARAINVPRHFVELLPAKRWIVLSTDQVYDGATPEKLYQEIDARIGQPCCNVYGQTKLEMEQLFLQSDYLKDQTAILRSSIMLGPKTPFCPSHDTFLDFIASRGDTPTTYYANEIRNVIAIQDVCRICAALMRNSDYAAFAGIYNLGGPAPVSRYDLAVAVLEHLQRDHRQLAVAATKALPSASPLNLSMDCSKLRAALPEIGGSLYSLSDMIASTFASST